MILTPRQLRFARMKAVLTEVIYVYRDGANYKWWGTFAVSGELKLEELRPHLIDGMYFVPESIGIPSLRPPVRSVDDVDWHEIHSTSRCFEGAAIASADQLLVAARERNKKGWFV